MNRREFIQRAAALSAAGLAPVGAWACESPPWSLGFEGLTADLEPLAMSLEGEIPAACHGTVYRNGPALYKRGGRRYRHWFDPDGMVQAFSIGAAGVEHRGRFVRTRRFLAEEQAGRFLYNGTGTRFSDAQPGRNNEDYNVANINVQPLNGELLALWEAGSAYRVDPVTLETLGAQSWSEELHGVPFSAHPRFDERGDLWNIGSVSFSHQPMLVLYHVGCGSQLRKSKVVPLDFAGYMHDFVLTPRFLVALNSSAVIGAGDTFVERFEWQPGRPSQLLVFDRNDFSLLATVEVPPAFVFHFGNGWEGEGRISFTACQYADASLVTLGMRQLAQQACGPYHHRPDLKLYTIDLAKARAHVDSAGLALEFPGFDRAAPFAAQPLIGVGGQDASTSSLGTAMVRFDPGTGEAQRFDYGEGIIVEEPLFLSTKDGGYIIHTLLDYRRRRSGLAILKADRLADGPLAIARTDRVLPLGFHGCFCPRAPSGNTG